MDRRRYKTSSQAELLKWGGLILVLAFLGLTGSHLAASAAARGTKNPSLPQDDYLLYLPFVTAERMSYYIDSVNGSDANPGTSPNKPWRTLAPVHAMEFIPGSMIHFKRGSSWTGDGAKWSGALEIDDSGTQNRPALSCCLISRHRRVLLSLWHLPSASQSWLLQSEAFPKW